MEQGRLSDAEKLLKEALLVAPRNSLANRTLAALYLPTFGVRTEVNVFVEERGARVTGEMQTEFVRLC